MKKAGVSPDARSSRLRRTVQHSTPAATAPSCAGRRALAARCRLDYKTCSNGWAASRRIRPAGSRQSAYTRGRCHTGGSIIYGVERRATAGSAYVERSGEGGRRRTNWGEAANGQRLAGVKSAEAGPRSPLQFGRWPAGRRRCWLLHGRHSDGLTQKPSGWANGDGPRRCPEIALQ